MLNFGGFLSSNFWTNYRCSSSASVEDLLSSKECTVDKLLDDDDCLQEFKNYNDKLIKYFDHDKLKVLVDYITVMPEKDEQKRGHKYPFIAGEIFNCEINQILDKFFEAPVKVKPQPALAPSESGTEVSESTVTKEEDDEKKEEPKGDTGVVGDKEPVTTDDKVEEKEAGETTPTEETPAVTTAAESTATEEKKEDGAKTTEEVAPQRLETDTTEEKVETKETTTAVTDATPPQDGEPKEDTTVVAATAPEVPAAATETETKTEVVEPEGKEKNTQEPESEEPDKENTEVKPTEVTPKPTEVPATTEVVEEKKASEEPEEEDTVKKTEEKPEKDLASMASFSTLQTEAQDDDEEEEEGSKYLLLERLFKFIKTEGDEQLNPVLSGYFCKLVSLLISRKQKQLFPFIFAKDSTVIEDLLRHVYQKSISEILNKLLTLVDSDHEPEILAEVKAKQQMAVGHLIDSLGPEKSEEHNLNACTIIQDMFEIKEFYNLICSKASLTRIVDFALAGMPESTKASKCSSLTVLNQIVLNHIERQKKKDQKADEDKDNGHDEDDDMIVQQNSDDEAADDLEASNPNSAAAQTAVLVDILKEKVGAIATVLQADHEGATIQSSVNEAHYVPLGQQRLHTIELVLRMVQLKKETLYTGLGRSAVFANIMVLVKKYPWNNFMQLKVITMCEEILENCESEDFKKDFLEGSGIGKALVAMGAEASFKMNSERLIRNGYMGLVVSVSNKLVKRFKGTTNKPEDATVVEYLDNVGEEWRAFVDDELANSNTNDNKTLGGSTKPDDGGSEGGDDPSNIDDQMEKIMQRFSNFNQMLTNNSNDNDEEEEEEGDGDDAGTGDEDTKDDEKGSASSMKQDKVDLKEIDPLDQEYIDNSYWNLTNKTAKEEDIDYDSLLAELDA